MAAARDGPTPGRASKSDTDAVLRSIGVRISALEPSLGVAAATPTKSRFLLRSPRFAGKRDVGFDRLQNAAADAGYTVESGHAAEGAIRFAIGDDGLGKPEPNPRKPSDLLGSGAVEIDPLARPEWAGKAHGAVTMRRRRAGSERRNEFDAAAERDLGGWRCGGRCARPIARESSKRSARRSGGAMPDTVAEHGGTPRRRIARPSTFQRMPSACLWLLRMFLLMLFCFSDALPSPRRSAGRARRGRSSGRWPPPPGSSSCW